MVESALYRELGAEQSFRAPETGLNALEAQSNEFVAESLVEDRADVERQADSLLRQVGQLAKDRFVKAVDWAQRLPETYSDYKNTRKTKAQEFRYGSAALPETDLGIERDLSTEKMKKMRWLLENGFMEAKDIKAANETIQEELAYLRHLDAVEEERTGIRPNIAKILKEYDES